MIPLWYHALLTNKLLRQHSTGDVFGELLTSDKSQKYICHYNVVIYEIYKIFSIINN